MIARLAVVPKSQAPDLRTTCLLIAILFKVAFPFMLLSVILVALAQSQPPDSRSLEVSKPPQKGASGVDQQPDTNKRGTRNLPLVVETLESDADRNEKVDAAKHRKEDASRNWWVMIFTGGLLSVTVAQAFLFFWQLRLIKRSVKDAEAATEVAKESLRFTRESFLAANRPRLVLRDAYCAEMEMGELIQVSYVLANVGETQCHIVGSAINVEVLSSFGFGARTMPAVRDSQNDVGVQVLQSGEQRELLYTSEHLRWDSSNDTRHESGKDSDGLFFSGHLIYDDERGVKRHMAFHRRFRIGAERFFKVEDINMRALEYE